MELKFDPRKVINKILKERENRKNSLDAMPESQNKEVVKQMEIVIQRQEDNAIKMLEEMINNEKTNL